MKHIEQITSEQAIGEINRLALSDDMLTTALSEPYAQATGIEVQLSAPVTSDVEEMPSWMTYLLRKMFSTTARVFRGVSLLSEFRAVYSWLRKRLSGSEDYHIPSVSLDSSKPMSEHLRLLDNRKISNGNNSEIEDGVSLVRLLASQESFGKITELIDDNKDWIMDSNLPTTLTASVTKAILGFKELEVNNGKVTQFFVNSNLEELHLPYAENIYVRIGLGNGNVKRFLQDSTNLRVLDFPKLKKLLLTGGDGSAHGIWNIKGEDTMVFPELESFYNNSNANSIRNWTECRVLKFPKIERTTVKNTTWLYQMPRLEELYMPKFIGFNERKTASPSMIGSCPMLRKVVFGVLIDNMKQATYNKSMLFNDCPQVIHFEIGQNTNVSLVLNLWNPTYALLTEDLTEEITNEETGEVMTKVILANSLVEEGEPFANNREKFLYNFQTFLVDRLADKTGQSALTLTLSAEVYAALEAQDGQTILATLTNKNWTVTTA